MNTPLLFGPAPLFCPAHRPERIARALAVARTVIVDLEDGVPADLHDVAREALVATPVADPERVIVRINSRGSPEHDRDLAAVARTPYRRIMLAKSETPEDFDGLDRYRLLALCETPLGVLNVGALAAHPRVEALMLGAEDLAAALGSQGSRDDSGRYRQVALHARSAVLIAARAHDCAALDSVYVDIHDDAGLVAEALDAASSGFSAKPCVHPRQVSVVADSFRPSDAAIEHARRVVEANSGAGAILLDGTMVDEPVVRQARRVLALARGDAPDV